MRQVLDRMRAAFSLPGAWLIVIALLLVLFFSGMGQESGTSLEARIAKALSAMEGYGLLVSQVCQDNDLKYYYGPNTVTYTALFLIKEHK